MFVWRDNTDFIEKDNLKIVRHPMDMKITVDDLSKSRDSINAVWCLRLIEYMNFALLTDEHIHILDDLKERNFDVQIYDLKIADLYVAHYIDVPGMR